MRSAVVVFPGSNCDRDLARAFRLLTGRAPALVWHAESELPSGLDVIGLPGGFSHGDYLRSGAIAARAPILRAVARAAERGVTVVGICNGFQMLTEAGMLPGALLRNLRLDFVCRETALDVEAGGPLADAMAPGARLTVPVAHHHGRFVADDDMLDRLEAEGRVLLRYAEEVNGSARGIAGIAAARGRVFGLMPHPERAMEEGQGSTDGRRLLAALAAMS